MIAWAFVVLLQPIGGGMQSEAFDYDNSNSCQEKRAVLIEYLLNEPKVMEFYVGDCQRVQLSKKT